MIRESRSVKGLSFAFSASILLSIFALAYVAFLAYGVPGYCKEAEARMMTNYLEDMSRIASKSREVINTGQSTSVAFSEKYAYPVFPLFLTPDYALVSHGTYDLTITISNIKSPEINIPDSIILRGKGVWTSLNLIYTPPLTTYIEVGVVSNERTHLSGMVLSGSEISLPLFYGNTLSKQLSPASGGGKGIIVQNNTNNNITIQITGSKIPQSAWWDFANKSGLRVDYNSTAVTIHIPPGHYILKTGLASFTEIPQNRSAAYLLSDVPTSQRSPGVISVIVLDEFFNPVPESVDIRCIQPCTIQYITCTGSSCTNVTAQTSVKLPKGQKVSAVIDPNYSGVTMATVSVNRSVGGPYQLAYLIAE
ncbi:MAG: hypothetical protein QXT86_11040 [Archaeoglobaceae archaeon]